MCLDDCAHQKKRVVLRRRLRRTGLTPKQKQLAAQWVPLVYSVVRTLSPNVPVHVSRDDMAQAGMVGLLRAVRRYDGRDTNTFSTYARFRITGAMLDWMRKEDWLDRSSRKFLGKRDEAMHALGQELGRDPTEDEIAQHLGLSAHAFHEQQHHANRKVHSISALQEYRDDSSNTPSPLQIPDPQADVHRQASENLSHTRIRKILGLLNPREAFVVEQHILEERPFHSIGRDLNVVESRAAQIFKRAMTKLRARIAPRLRQELADD